MKIVVVGNSVGLRVRPPIGKSYAVLLNSMENVDVINLSQTARLSKYFAINTDQILCYPADVVIINLGVVDLCSRPVPYWYNRMINRQGYTLIGRLVVYLNLKLVYSMRRWLVYLRLKMPWTTLREFRHNMSYILSRIKKEQTAEVIVLSINKPSSRVEYRLPGSIDRIEKGNEILQELCETHSSDYLPLHLDQLTDYPDGVHFSESGHQKVFDHIRDLLNL